MDRMDPMDGIEEEIGAERDGPDRRRWRDQGGAGLALR